MTISELLQYCMAKPGAEQSVHSDWKATQIKVEYVAIIGAGAIGLMAALSARHYKATPILIDIVEERLRYAQKL
ncbi:hypothetical protein MJM28_31405, partial [Salmonella enterica subsp. enterica serovar Montevideo]|nr:hypothetical protein [Salmonella enterica subsp. enterica serovar Montevideo]